ncbi:MAG TPA: Hsp20/alpha crystallin family protein [Pirellulaceae bacterium]|nr:Hsp20/alpha crystallin family protein [Pirellulaceae bacterium]
MNDTMECTNSGGCEVARPQSKVTFTPRFDIWENDQEYVLAGDLPGVDPQELEIRYENQELAIHGKVAPRDGEARYFAVEYGVGDFHRGFRLGDQIDGSAIAAELKGGVLTVRLPKRAEARPRKNTVTAG